MQQQNLKTSGFGINAILFFGFGIAAGILIAFSGFGYLKDSAALIATVFLAALLVVLLLGVLLYAARRRIWAGLFGFAEVQIEQLANPLASVAERAIAGDPAGATTAARDLVALALARYSWITTRRWIIASLTALIAAMAALAGTALLFEQNRLLEAQSGLLKEQNARIAEQTELIAQQTALAVQQVQLAEAARNGALAVEVTGIAEELAASAEQAFDKLRADAVAAGRPLPQLQMSILYQNPETDLSASLIQRIVALSRAIRPYRYLDLGHRPGDTDGLLHRAFERRRADLPDSYARMAEAMNWPETDGGAQLTDRPASPERGQLLLAMLGSGVRNLELLNSSGLEMAFAVVQDQLIIEVSAQIGSFAYADFTGSQLVAADFRGARLENARFHKGVLDAVQFGILTTDAVRSPLKPEHAPVVSLLIGTDFSGSVIKNTDFAGANLMASNFDAALLVRAGFAQAGLSAATFRGAVILSADFTGAKGRAMDFDGAILFGDDVPGTLSAAMPDSFDPADYRAEPVAMADVMAIRLVSNTLTEAEVATATAGNPAVRLVRIAP